MDRTLSFDPLAQAQYDPLKMGKTTLFASSRILVGLNAFEPGQEHPLHRHAEMDKLYQVISGSGTFLMSDGEKAISPGDLLVAPAGVAHGIRNSSGERLLVLAVLAPAPAA
jgi:quercetin dioxygenase-like cupin family protein